MTDKPKRRITGTLHLPAGAKPFANDLAEARGDVEISAKPLQPLPERPENLPTLPRMQPCGENSILGASHDLTRTPQGRPRLVMESPEEAEVLDGLWAQAGLSGEIAAVAHPGSEQPEVDMEADDAFASRMSEQAGKIAVENE